MLFDVEAREKEMILKSCVASCSEHLDKFTTTTIAYFRNLLQDARVSIKFKSEAAQTSNRIFKDDLYSLDFQLWLNEVFNLKYREELEQFLSLAENDDSTQALGRKPLILEKKREFITSGKLTPRSVFIKVMGVIL